MRLFEYIELRQDKLVIEVLTHVSLVMQCTIIAAAAGVLIGVAVYRSAAGSAIATALSSAALTIPSFALIGLMIPSFGLGSRPAVVVLVIYGLLPIIRNTVVGLNGVDPAVSDAAKGIGMNRIAVLTKVELRLAWPAILAGMRVATQLLMGIAAIAAYAKGPGLGIEIFAGLQNSGSAFATEKAIVGTVGIVLLALLLDGLYVLVARFTTSRGLRA